MDKLPSSQSPQINKTAPAQETRSAATPKPASILGFLAGARSAVGDAAKQAQETAGRMSSALETVKNKVAEELSVPKLPEGQATTQRPLTPEQKAQEARREIISKAQDKTLSGNPFDPNADVTELLKAGVNKAGTDEKAIRELFWDRTPEQIKAIEAVYNDRRPENKMWDDLNSEFEDPNDRKMMDAFRRGDRVGAASAALVDATTGNTSKDRVEAVLDRLSPEEAAKVQERYKQDHPSNKDLSNWVERKFSGEREQQMKALLEGDKEAADFASMKLSLRRKDGDGVIEALRSKSPDERAAFIEKYNAQAGEGRDLESQAGRLSGTDRDQAMALLKGNEAGADAALLQDAMDGMGSNKDKIWNGLGSDIQDPEERKAYVQSVEREYNKMYGPESARKGKSLEARLKSELGGENEQRALSLLSDGQLSNAEKMTFALSGNDRDGEEIASLVRRLGPEKAREEYKEQTGRDLDKDVQNRLKGVGRFEAQDALKGEPGSAEEMVERVRARAEFENPRGASRLAGAFTNADEQMWKNVGRAEEALGELQEARKSGDERQVALAEKRVAELTGYAREDSSLYRDEKEGAVEVAATVATTAAAVAVTVGTAGTAGPLVATGLAMSAAAAANVGTRAGLQGGAYDSSLTNIATDAAWGAVEGVGIKGGMVAGRIGREGVEGLVKAGAKTRKFTGAVAEGAIDGAVGGGISGAGQTALSDGTWDDGIASGLLKVTGGGALGASVGAAAGGALGAPSEVVADVGAAGVRKLGIGGKSASRQADAAISQADVAARQADVEGNSVPNRAGVEGVERQAASVPAAEALPETAWINGTYKESQAYKALSPERQAEADDLISKQVTEVLSTTNPQVLNRQVDTGRSLMRMMESGKLWATDQKGVTLATRLKSLRDNPRNPKLSHEAREIYESTVRMVDQPGRLHQGQRGSCAAATLQYLHATTDPVDFVRVMDGLTGQSGKVRLRSGKQIEVNQSSLETYRFDRNTGEQVNFDGETGEFLGLDRVTGLGRESSKDTLALMDEVRKDHPTLNEDQVQILAVNRFQQANRGPVSRIYQSTAMDRVANLDTGLDPRVVTKQYDNLAHQAKDGKFVSTEKLQKMTPEERAEIMDGSVGGFKTRSVYHDEDLDWAVGDGLTPAQQKALRQEFLGRRVDSGTVKATEQDKLGRIGSADQPKLEDFDLETLETVQKLYRAAELADQGQAVSIGVRWGESPNSGHAVALVGTNENGDFIIRNSQSNGRMDVPFDGELPRDPSPEAVGAERSQLGYSVVKKEDLVKRLRSVTLMAEGSN